MKFDKKRFMENLNKAKQCHGCTFLHIGQDVDHNHCDCRHGDSHWQDHRVNGHYNHPGDIYYKYTCIYKKRKTKKSGVNK